MTGKSNKLHRVDGPHSYRLMAVELTDGQWIGQTAGGNSLREDIAAYRRSGCKPLYAVFIRPVPALAITAFLGEQRSGVDRL